MFIATAGDDQELADFYASQQPSTSGSGRPQCKTNNQSVLTIINIYKMLKIYFRALLLVDWCV